MDVVPKENTLIVLGDFNAVSNTSSDGYEACICPHGSVMFSDGEQDKLPNAELCYASWIEGCWIVVPETGLVALDRVFKYLSGVPKCTVR